MVAFDLFEDGDQSRRGDGGVDLDVQCLAVEIVHHVERPEASPAGECVAHEVDRPHGIGQPRHEQRHAFGNLRDGGN